MRSQEEHKIQVAVCTWLAANRLGRSRFAVPSGAHLARGARGWAWLQAEGARAGVPDLIIGPGLALEVKTKTGKLSDAQKTMHDLMRADEWTVLVGYGLADCVEQLKEALTR